MQVTVKYFASLRELLGRGEERLQIPNHTKISDLWEQCRQGHQVPDQCLFAVNMVYAKDDQVLAEGDEVAFFPPVTGG